MGKAIGVGGYLFYRFLQMGNRSTCCICDMMLWLSRRMLVLCPLGWGYVNGECLIFKGPFVIFTYCNLLMLNLQKALVRFLYITTLGPCQKPHQLCMFYFPVSCSLQSVSFDQFLQCNGVHSVSLIRSCVFTSNL